MRDRRALIAADIGNARLQQRLGDGKNALAPELGAGTKLQVFHFPREGTFCHPVTYLTVLKNGTVFVTGHLLAGDVRNQWGYTTGFLHRSTDAGRTWQSTRIESEKIKPGAGNHTTRNVLEMADGSLLLGVDYDGGGGPYFVWRSADGGQTWDKTQRCEPRDFRSQYGFFGGETWLWQARSGKVWALVRVDSNEFPIKDRPIG